MADKKRRRSLRNVFKRPETPPATPSLPSGPSSPAEKRVDVFAASPVDSQSSSPRIRPRTLQKANRTSVFGSLRSLQSLDEDDHVNLTRSDSKASSIDEDGFVAGQALIGETIILHGEVQVAGSTMFRKRNHYLVLTDSHLVRFKSQGKAAELFPSLSSAPSRMSMSRTSTSSAVSLTDLHISAHNEVAHGTALDQIVAVYKLDDGRPYFTVEVSSLEEQAVRASSMQLQFPDMREADTWVSAIRSAAAQARSAIGDLFQNRMTDHVGRIMESHKDYDPSHFRVFKAVQLLPSKANSKASSDDLSKLSSVICYVGIGVNRVYLVPVPRISKKSSSTSLTEYETTMSYGIVNLSLIKLVPDEDICRVCFTTLGGQSQNLLLASCHAEDIVLWLRFASEYVRPEWTIQPFIFDVPAKLDERMNPPSFPPEDYNCFERTLIAYSAAYNVDISRITYTVDDECEDAPCFRLLAPLGLIGYSSMELLAVMRALRYNEYFCSISFAGIDLRSLRDTYDPSGSDIDSQSTRSGTSINLPGHAELSVLSQEIRALALKSRRLRRLDFTNAMSAAKAGDEQCSGIPVALTPLSKKSLTNVDWVVLSGIQLGEVDLDHLVDAASERLCHIRALEVADCGLSVHDIDVLLSTLSIHENTMEVIDIAGVQGRFSPELFQRGIGAFGHIRRLNLARCQKTAGPEPLLTSDILLSWRLESLYLSQTALNEQMIEALCAYLSDAKSNTLKELHVNQCGLKGTDLAMLLQSITRPSGITRVMHVNASENRLSMGSSLLARAIAVNQGPTSLSMRMMDFEKEHHFRELLDAIAVNNTLRILDISRASLPYDAGSETCEALKDMFAQNQTLEELDISGEHAHLDAVRFGIGLNIALQGLRSNRVLKLLRIEHQNLGLQGASTLASVLEVNDSLLEIHCEHNEINLQSFTVLVNALRKNKTLLYMPDLTSDKARSLEKVKEEFEHADRSDDPRSHAVSRSNTLKKGISAFSQKALSRHASGAGHAGHHRKTSSIASNVSFTDQDVVATLAALEERWQIQQSRLQQYLARNYNVTVGIPLSPLLQQELELDEQMNSSGSYGSDNGRPNTADSLGRLLAKVKMDRTPTVEKPSALDAIGLTVGGEQAGTTMYSSSFGHGNGHAGSNPFLPGQHQKHFMFELPEEDAST